jgi:5-methylcytosine-specific restriction endonuclease McrA
MAYADKAKEAAYRKAYHIANKAKIAARKKAYREAHKAKMAAREKAFAAANKVKIAAYQKAYQKAYRVDNKERLADIQARRRARKRRGMAEKISRAVVFERDAGICHICGKKVDPNRWHLEHIVPLSKGGEHSYRNVAVSHPECNLSKGTKSGSQLRGALV